MREIACFAVIVACIMAIVALKPAKPGDKQVIIEKPIITELPEKTIVKEVPVEVPKIVEKKVFVPRPPAVVRNPPVVFSRPRCSQWSYFRMGGRLYRSRRCRRYGSLP